MRFAGVQTLVCTVFVQDKSCTPDIIEKSVNRKMKDAKNRRIKMESIMSMLRQEGVEEGIKKGMKERIAQGNIEERRKMVLHIYHTLGKNLDLSATVLGLEKNDVENLIIKNRKKNEICK